MILARRALDTPADRSPARHARGRACRLAVALAVAVACAAAPAPDLATAAVPSAPPPVSSTAYVVLEPATGAVLAARAPDRRVPMASTTKMMTALIAVERAAPDEVATVPAEAMIGGSTAGLVAGERITVRDLLVGLLVPSGNDAAVTLATHVAGSQARFVALMNARARALGLTHTRFATPHGLDRPGHYSSPRDLVRLAQEVMRHPELRRIVAMRTAVIPGPSGRGRRLLRNRNDLLGRDPDVDGVKTGHTAGAGYALVVHARRRGLGVELYGAFLGAPSEAARSSDAERLLDWAFARFARPTLVRDGQVFGRSRVRDRPGVTVALRARGTLAAPVRIGEPITEEIVARPEVIAPVRAGAVLGTVTVRAAGRVLGRRALVAAHGVSAPSLGERLEALWERILP